MHPVVSLFRPHKGLHVYLEHKLNSQNPFSKYISKNAAVEVLSAITNLLTQFAYKFLGDRYIRVYW